MSGFDGERTAIDAYQRLLQAVTENQAVDAAESVLAGSWLSYLGDMRRCALDLADATRGVHQEAMARLHAAESADDPIELADARELVERVEGDLDGDMAASQRLLASVEGHIESVSRAGAERVQRKQDDLDRLNAAWTAAYGEPQSDDR